ncbi:DUF2790 domain-containing protein [Pseudomonas sp. D1-2]|uniref:DUF2790 domain-containing protein n=1 Tax=unclassified Pseudomonas TaxID=196821 RepID=UPI003DA87735
MNTKAIYAACLFAALSICTLSARAESTAPAHTYTYGTHLDVRKVLSLSEDPQPACGVVNAHMTYLDSAGHEQALDYRKLSDNCTNQN